MKAKRSRDNIYWLKRTLFCYKNIKIKSQFLQKSCCFHTLQKTRQPASQVQVFQGYKGNKASDPYPYSWQPIAWPLCVTKPLPIPRNMMMGLTVSAIPSVPTIPPLQSMMPTPWQPMFSPQSIIKTSLLVLFPVFGGSHWQLNLSFGMEALARLGIL